MARTEQDHRFRVFGADARVIVRAESSLAPLRVHALFRRLHRILTRFDPGSELSALNARAGTEVAVSPLLLRAVQAAIWAARASDGLVDPTILGDLERIGYLSSRDGHVSAPLADALRDTRDRRPAAPRRPSRWTAIEVDAARGAVRLPAGVRIDLGGSAKGLAVDLAAESIGDCRSYAVDAGGDIRVGGIDAAPRRVFIPHPLSHETAHSFMITSGAVATSGLQSRIWRTGHGFAHHLIDPARGTSAWTGVIQATALAPTTLEAETLAKTALLRGPHAGRALLAHYGGALILDDGALVLAGGLTRPASGAAA